MLQLGHSSIVRASAFSPDGTLLASGAVDATAELWKVNTGAVVATLVGNRLTADSAGGGHLPGERGQREGVGCEPPVTSR